jgi:transposase
MGKYRSYSAEFKVQVVLEALKGQKTEAQICREHNIAPDLLTHWKQNFLERAPQLFASRQQQSAEQERIAELERLVGQLTMELAASKKVSRLLPSRSRSDGKS